jgi:hypothetical protein
VKIYQYRSPIGRFLIKPQANGRWGLWFKDDLLGSYHSALAAADDVDIPTDISEWEVVAR